MTETLANAIVGLFGTDSGMLINYLIIFGVSMLPILELRGGLIVAYALGVPLIPAMIVCFIGNILPIPFLLMFVKKALNWLGKFKIFKPLVDFIQHRGEKKAQEMKEKQNKIEEWALLAFVAIPLPGTGGWTGSLVATLLDMDNKKAFKVISIGVAIAGIIVAALSYGLFDFIKNLF